MLLINNLLLVTPCLSIFFFIITRDTDTTKIEKKIESEKTDIHHQGVQRKHSSEETSIASTHHTSTSSPHSAKASPKSPHVSPRQSPRGGYVPSHPAGQASHASPQHQHPGDFSGSQGIHQKSTDVVKVSSSPPSPISESGSTAEEETEPFSQAAETPASAKKKASLKSELCIKYLCSFTLHKS